MRKLAKEFGLSDQGLAKKCRKYKIPRPPVGYWAKVELGKRISRPKLPPNSDPSRETIEFAPAAVPLEAAPPEPPDPRISPLDRVDPERAKRRRLPLIQESRQAFKDAYAK